MKIVSPQFAVEVSDSECLTGALLDRLTHRVHILTADGEIYRVKEAKKHSKRPVWNELI